MLTRHQLETVWNQSCSSEIDFQRWLMRLKQYFSKTYNFSKEAVKIGAVGLVSNKYFLKQ